MFMTYDSTAVEILRKRMRNSEMIGQVKYDQALSVTFDHPATVEIAFTATQSCETEVKCLTAATTNVAVDNFDDTAYKVKKCYAEMLVNSTKTTIGEYFDNQAANIEFNYSKAEDLVWLGKIAANLTAETLNIGDDILGQTISTYTALIKQSITATASAAELDASEVAVAVSPKIYGAIEGDVKGVIALNGEATDVKLISNGLGTAYIYQMSQVEADTIFTSGDGYMTYIHDLALKYVMCDNAGWSEGTGSESGSSFYKKDYGFASTYLPNKTGATTEYAGRIFDYTAPVAG